MAGELFKARNEFVESMNDELINQLLGDLMEDRVLNRGETVSIVGVNRNTLDKARQLIDTVIAKKDAASLKMIGRIENRDPNLYSRLNFNLSIDESPPQAAAAPQTEWSDKLIHCNERFWREKQLDEKVYPAFKNTLRKRVALMITNIVFTNVKLNRRGAETDEKNMYAMLTALGYEVVKYTNCTAKKIDEALKNFSQHEKLRDTDSVIVVLMSHGTLGHIVGVNHKEDCADLFPIDNICKHLNTPSCPALENKPKVVIVQACRGEDSGSFLICDGTTQLVSDASPSAPEENLVEDHLRYVPTEEDFIFLFSSTPHNVSYRDPVHGSILIQAVFNVFNTFAHEEHIEDLFRSVTNYCKDRLKGQEQQIPTRDRCTLSKKFYLFPGI